MDLLNANEQRESEMAGFPEQDEWMDRRSTNNLNNYNRASTSYNKLTNSGRRDPLETTHVGILSYTLHSETIAVPY